MAYALYGMPLLIHAVAWWLAGLVADAWWAAGWPWALLVLAAAVLLRTRRLEPLLLPAALLVAWSSRAERDGCTHRVHSHLQQERAVSLHVHEVTRGTGRRPTTARGTIADNIGLNRCVVSATVQFVVSDTMPLRASAGVTLRLKAHSLHVGTGLRLSEARVTGTLAERDLLLAWRAKLGQVIDDRFRRRAPLVRALLIADQH